MRSTRAERSSLQTLASGIGAGLAACLLLISPSVAGAVLMTLTFDDGDYDPNITYPGGELHGPYDWIESNGIRAAGFWATNVGTAGAGFQLGHTHIQPNYSGRPDGGYERMHSWTDDLQGLNISLESGDTFDLVSIDYSIRERDTTHPDLLRLAWPNGPEDARLLLAESWDPTVADLESQWTSIAIDDFGLPFRPWFTQTITGFDNLTSFYVSHTTASLGIDTIVIDVHSANPVPEPSAAVLIGLGLAGLSRRARRPVPA